MKILSTASFLVLSCILATSALADRHSEDGIKIKKTIPTDGEDSSVLIETTKNAKIRNDYEIVSGEEEIAGDPTAGTKEAYKSWKEACAEWKKELRENNKDGKIITMNCGSHSFTRDEASGNGSGVYVYKSTGKYKIRVRLKD